MFNNFIYKPENKNFENTNNNIYNNQYNEE